MQSEKTGPKMAKLTIDDKEYDFPILEPTVGYPAIDLRELLKKTGYLSFDPGFKSTASCTSSITYIDGDKGILRYRGYDITELSERCSYLQVCALLLYGELLDERGQREFEEQIYNHTMVLEDISEIFKGIGRRSHPMAMMITVVAALSASYHNAAEFDTHDRAYQELTAIRLIAKMPTLAAMCYKHRMNQPFMYPDNTLGYVENFLQMLFGTPCGKAKISPVAIAALEQILILHADHEQNASTSTARTAGSSGADPYTCISAAIASLWGPAHGGANEAVLKMLDDIGSPENIDAFIARAKDPNDPFRLMGFGHRVYKNFDPRAIILKENCDRLLKELGVHSPQLKIAEQLEHIALNDEYFKQRNLYPNVDFYSGIILKALNIPVEMFTVIFVMGRTVGWISHWIEMMREPSNAIVRPRQLYTGVVERELDSVRPALHSKK